MTPLIRATLNRSPRVMEMLLKYGASTTVSDMNGNTPLHLAASFGNSELVQLLLSYNCPKNTENRFWKTPLMEACSHGNEGAVRSLLDHLTTEVMYMNGLRKTALIYAVMGVSSIIVIISTLFLLRII